jgi:hypothetical protein
MSVFTGCCHGLPRQHHVSTRLLKSLGIMFELADAMRANHAYLGSKRLQLEWDGGATPFCLKDL